jgi:hypothetical protein
MFAATGLTLNRTQSQDTPNFSKRSCSGVGGISQCDLTFHPGAKKQSTI